MTLRSCGRIAGGAGLALVCATILHGQQAPPLPAGVTREVVHEDARALIARLTFKPGARETMHTHPFEAVIVQIDAGDVEMTVGEKKSSGPSAAGTVTVVPKDVPHAAANIGKSDVTVVTVALK
jgi:quercetin dioxygenase-like cupin family protein